jgi:hypothetical protein
MSHRGYKKSLSWYLFCQKLTELLLKNDGQKLAGHLAMFIFIISLNINYRCCYWGRDIALLTPINKLFKL